jgi:predicted Zn-dependent protease
VRFDPSLPDDRVNVSGDHPIREAALLVGGVVGLGAGFIVLIALTIDVIVVWIPPRFEAGLFANRWTAGFFEEDDEEQDPRSADLVALVDRLAAHWHDNPYALRAFVQEEESPNAMALPGGVIIVTTGLLDGVESENELAFVLGHELGHFRNRDHLRGMGRGLAFGMVMTGLGIGGDGAAELAGLAGQIASRSFDRDQESEADRFGLELVAAEYGHVAASWEFFERLPEPDGEVERELVHYLSTHPLGNDRIEALEVFADERGWSREGVPVPIGAVH